ncbi:MAG: hypothetical protein IPL96_00495 [Holophagaceae bacterium]|nr:hypothetical protein [Holophagaceae bacterium]
MPETPPLDSPRKKVGLLLACEGLGDCLYGMAVIRKMHERFKNRNTFDVFTHHPGLFQACPFIDQVYPITDETLLRAYPFSTLKLFELDKFEHWSMDTYDLISLPLRIGQLSFREKQLAYFPVEEDRAETFDVVLNTSVTWPSRSWSLANWQRLADRLLEEGLSVAVVGKDVHSAIDRVRKLSPPLEGCRNLVNQLSLDQTYFTIRKCGLFVTCQNGLSVLAGATDTEVVVLDMSIEWSKRAIYRNEDPHYKATYVKGNCLLYCTESMKCPLPENEGEFKCIPTFERVAGIVLDKVKALRRNR